MNKRKNPECSACHDRGTDSRGRPCPCCTGGLEKCGRCTAEWWRHLGPDEHCPPITVEGHPSFQATKEMRDECLR